MSQSENHGRFVWHELMTSDPTAAEHFYRDVVGWDAKPVEGGNHSYTTWIANGAPIGGMMETPAGANAPPSWTGYIEVDDADATVNRAKELGASVIMGPHTAPGVGRFAILTDPQGAVFAVIKSETSPTPETDPKPLEFSWHEYMANDWKAANEFYSALFGWKKQSEMEMSPMGTYYMFGRDRFTYGGMMNRPANMPAQPHWLHYVSVRDSADAAADRATKGGATVINGPMEVPGGDRIAAMIDPQGAGFAVHSKPASPKS
ncbi:MAG TPA: VOC family protein [Gemmatimonadaceae bacterium]